MLKKDKTGVYAKAFKALHALKRELRRDMVTQAQLAEKINVSEQTVNRALSGKHEISLSTFLKLLDGAGYDLYFKKK